MIRTLSVIYSGSSRIDCIVIYYHRSGRIDRGFFRRRSIGLTRELVVDRFRVRRPEIFVQ
ncbi:hypothetical protein D8S78_14055 [Natrialba swarupiae]|nr:hypothetical protein [Natrialba swarupiae]